MTNATLFEKDFFRADGNHPKYRQALTHFRLAFKEPPKFEELVSAIRPNPGQKKIVIVDGHPRSGKTWCIAKAIDQIIKEDDLKRDQWWTSGVDSLKVYPDNEGNLYEGAELVKTKLAESLDLNAPKKLIFLDDFIGTNHPRPFGNRLYGQRIRSYFLWDENENEWLKRLGLNDSAGYTLVLTGRSLHFTLADTLLDLKMRKRAQGSKVKVRNVRLGLFRTIERGEPFGAFDRDTLKDVSKNNWSHHPLRKSEFLFLIAPLLAFDKENFPQAIEEVNKQAIDKANKYAAKALFGEDLKVLAEAIISVEKMELKASEQAWRKQVLNKLYELYLVAIAPGLLFLDRAAYEVLGIAQDLWKIVQRDLYLYETVDEFCSGRLPNEFYMIALDNHLNKFIEVAARGFARLVNPSGSKPASVDNVLGLGLRGLLERGLHKASSGALDRLLGVQEFRALLDVYLLKSKDCLIYLEVNQSPSEKCDVPMNPGLAAAIGWVLFSFCDQLDKKRIQETTLEWFPERFKRLLRDKLGEHHSSQNQEGKLKIKRHVIATYSTFLQWVIKLDQRLGSDRFLPRILSLPDESPESIRDELKAVVYDELIWALNENLIRPDLKTVDDLLRFLRGMSFDQAGDDSKKEQLITNLWFSLAWHSEWLEKATLDLREKLSDWLESSSVFVVSGIQQNPGLVEDNLQYHWWHFITQRAVWMRDWCFQDDPNEYERNYSQIPQGPKNPRYNEYIRSIASAVIETTSNMEVVRNILLLIGTRSARITDFDEILGKVDRLFDLHEKDAIGKAVLQSIFELARQGHLDQGSVNLHKNFVPWCQDKIELLQIYLDDSWRPYYKDLKQVTHLDLLPKEEGGWKDILPIEWEKKRL